jgi:uracil phosphoribosyltransferase
MIIQITHPLFVHKVGILRDKNVQPKQYRELVKELTLLLTIQATQHLELYNSGTSNSPVGEYNRYKIKPNIGLFPILRAGQGMVEPFLDLLPTAHVHHLGLYREKATLLPVEYYNKLPRNCILDLGFIVDPLVLFAHQDCYCWY